MSITPMDYPQPTFPVGTVRALLDTEHVSPATRHALRERLAASDAPWPTVGAFFSAQELTMLRAVCEQLLPQTDRERPVDIALAIDARLASGRTDGWRYDTLPADGDALRRLLHGLDTTALRDHGAVFADLPASERDPILSRVQRGDVTGDTWDGLPPRLIFADLLAEAAEIFASDPLLQEEIGYVGMADLPTWSRIGLNEREDREPIATTDQSSRLFERPRVNGTPSVVSDIAPSPAEDTPGFSPRLLDRMRRYDPTEVVDAVVIGTGPGGAPLLARLAAAGLHVVALEAGRFWDPTTEFATDERAQEDIFWTDERLSAGADALAFGKNNSGYGVGGGSLHYTGYVPRAQPGDLTLRSEFGVSEDWPIAFDELVPYYDEVERAIGVSGPSPYPWGPPRTPYPLPALPLNAAAQLMERGCAALGIRTSPAANAALSRPYFQPGIGWRRACTNRGFCQAGCTNGAKSSMDVTYIPLAIRAGAEVRPECHATLFERDERGRITGVVYTHQGREYRQRARHVFLCAGAIETPRLLLLNGLANGSGQVGRNFMAHAGLQVWGQFDEETRPYKGIPGGLISEDTMRPADADFAGGYLIQSIGVMPMTYAGQVARGRGLWGTALREHLRGYTHVAGINIHGECLPYDHNYLELADELDDRDLPKPRIHFTAGENERRMHHHADRLMRAIWDAAGGQDVWAFPRHAHTVGTCRMGTAPSRSVVDPDGRAHDVPNLWISDNSTFPSSLPVNPTLTICALSLRTADQFLRQLGRHEA